MQLLDLRSEREALVRHGTELALHRGQLLLQQDGSLLSVLVRGCQGPCLAQKTGDLVVGHHLGRLDRGHRLGGLLGGGAELLLEGRDAGAGVRTRRYGASKARRQLLLQAQELRPQRFVLVDHGLHVALHRGQARRSAGLGQHRSVEFGPELVALAQQGLVALPVGGRRSLRLLAHGLRARRGEAQLLQLALNLAQARVSGAVLVFKLAHLRVQVLVALSQELDLQLQPLDVRSRGRTLPPRRLQLVGGRIMLFREFVPQGSEIRHLLTAGLQVQEQTLSVLVQRAAPLAELLPLAGVALQGQL
mmetsp:Transcript_15713/g.43431  ORF Transcript_15713/g.43431 Transcript_15713/m.43431 type:complete len:304 (+) Transcript_15713:1125-2036(+)